NDRFRQFSFGRGTCAKAGAITVGSCDGLNHFWMSMTQDQRPPGADIINIFVAISIPDTRTLAAHDVRWITGNRLEGTYRRVHSSGNHAAGARMQVFTLVHG